MDARAGLAIQIGVFVVGLPVAAVAAVAVGGLCLRPAGERPIVAGLAVTAGLAAAVMGTAGIPPLPPVDTMHWVPFLAVAAFLGLALFDARQFRGGPLAAGLVGAALVALSGWLVTRPLLGAAEAPGAWLATTGAALVVAPWLAFERVQGRSNGPADVAALTFATFGASLAAVLAHSALLGQMLGSVTAALGAMTLLVWRRPALAPGHAATGVAYTTLAALVFYTLGYADLPVSSAVLLLLAPRLGAVAARNATGFRALALAGAVALVPGLTAAALAYAANAEPPAKAGQPDYDY